VSRALDSFAALGWHVGDVISGHTPPKIIAIGDLHGDYEAYRALLNEAGLIDRKGKWAAGETIFVQTGDIADRGPDSRKIIEHLQKLQKSARKKGGQVIALVGNHEAMNMTRDLRYVHKGEYEAFRTGKSRRLRAQIYKANKDKIEAYYRQRDPALDAGQIKELWQKRSPLGKVEHQLAWSPEGAIGSWMVKNPGVVLIDGYLFVHGGLSERYLSMTVNDMNLKISEALVAQDEDPASIINDEMGPLWYRGLIPDMKDPSDMTPKTELGTVLDRFGADHMIIGHTPVKSGIREHFGGRLIQIDTGIARYYGGARSFLRIEDGRIFAHDNGVVREIGGE